MTILHYNDSLGRPVYCELVELPQHNAVLFIDMSSEHFGMSITNSIEQAIMAYQEYSGETATYFEAYPEDVADTLTKVVLDEHGSPVWSTPNAEELMAFRDAGVF